MTKHENIDIFHVYQTSKVKMTKEHICKALGGLMWNWGWDYSPTANGVAPSGGVAELNWSIRFVLRSGAFGASGFPE